MRTKVYVKHDGIRAAWTMCVCLCCSSFRMPRGVSAENSLLLFIFDAISPHTVLEKFGLVGLLWANNNVGFPWKLPFLKFETGTGIELGVENEQS